MHLNRYSRVAVMAIALATLGLFAGAASATVPANGAVLFPYTFNDCPVTNLIPINNYPGQIIFDESNLICIGGQNMHTWDLSADGGLTPMILGNTDDFRLSATVDLQKGTTVAMEGGLLVSPWWAPNTDGYFNVRLPDGEIAVFGGVLPFFSFTGTFGVHYQGGPIRLDILYQSNCLTEANPGTMTYSVNYNGQTYVSPPLPMGCNLAEEPVHGCWGIRDNVRVGGRVANLMFNGGPDVTGGHNVGVFSDIVFVPLQHDCAVGAKATSWGGVKAFYR